MEAIDEVFDNQTCRLFERQLQRQGSLQEFAYICHREGWQDVYLFGVLVRSTYLLSAQKGGTVQALRERAWHWV